MATTSPAPPAAKKSTLEQLSKIPSVPGLYRHANGSYYAKVKVAGVRKVRALVTESGANIFDRKQAEIALANFRKKLTAPKSANITFEDLWKIYAEGYSDKADKTRANLDWVYHSVTANWPQVIKKEVADIKPFELNSFFVKRSLVLKPASYNDTTAHLKRFFRLAVSNGFISVSPYDKIPESNQRKDNPRTPDTVPTIPQCEAIVAHVRSQEFSDSADKSADMLALMHLAALGTAECILADWSKVDWQAEVIRVKRQKTGAYYDVPFYPHLKPFLTDLWERQSKPVSGRLISILSPKQALYNACKRLKLPAFSPRDFRKARIVWLLQHGMDVESIAAWQGHKDNGVLIRRTYANVINDSVKAHRKAQLAKLAAGA
jgi:integrase